jgi:hypothetical protein
MRIDAGGFDDAGPGKSEEERGRRWDFGPTCLSSPEGPAVQTLRPDRQTWHQLT